MGANNQINRKLLFGVMRNVCKTNKTAVKIAMGINVIKYIKSFSIDILPIANLIKVIIKVFRSDDPTTLDQAGDRALAVSPT